MSDWDRAGRGVLLLAALVWLAGAGVLAQNDSGVAVRQSLRKNVELVLVPVTVKDSQGKLVTDLRREDFRLLEDDKPQPIRYFSTDPFPLSAVILVDRDLSPGGQKTANEVLPVLASAFAPDDEFAVYAFGAYPKEVLGFTRDTNALLAALQSLTVSVENNPAPPPGIPGSPLSSGPRINSKPVGPGVPSPVPKTATPTKTIHDALFAAATALRGRERDRRRVVFLLSDGRNSRLNIHKYDETRDLLLAQDVSVYAIGMDNARFALGTTVLSDYARDTGGDVLTPLTRARLEQALQQTTEEARYQYTLVYAAPAREPTARRVYHRIAVKVDRPGVSVRARAGYFSGVPDE